MDKSLLILDDDAPLRGRLRRAMEVRGFEVTDAGTVQDLSECQLVSWGGLAATARQAAAALSFLHDQQLAHGDVKPHCMAWEIIECRTN